MSYRTAFGLLLAAVTLSAVGLSYAQGSTSSGGGQAILGLTGGYNLDAMDRRDRIDEQARDHDRALQKAGIDALQAKDFAVADHAFSQLLNQDPKNADLNFLMGITQIGLTQWEAARGYLETAAAGNPTRPEPKTRLGLTYVELGDMASAQKMRADLASLNVACGSNCKDAAWITDGMRLLDEAFAAKTETASAPVPTSISVSVDAAFKPADYGAAKFGSLNDVYRLITEEGRCPPGYKPEREEPCALIAYEPVAEGPGVYKQYYRPVFGVESRNSIWTMVGSEITAVSAKTLWAPAEVDNTITKGVKNTYRPLAVVGNRENTEKCKQAKPCLPQKALFQYYKDFKMLPQAFIEDFWGRKKMVDPGEKRLTTAP